MGKNERRFLHSDFHRTRPVVAAIEITRARTRRKKKKKKREGVGGEQLLPALEPLLEGGFYLRTCGVPRQPDRIVRIKSVVLERGERTTWLVPVPRAVDSSRSRSPLFNSVRLLDS